MLRSMRCQVTPWAADAVDLDRDEPTMRLRADDEPTLRLQRSDDIEPTLQRPGW
jgi:hypothetical protein